MLIAGVVFVGGCGVWLGWERRASVVVATTALLFGATLLATRSLTVLVLGPVLIMMVERERQRLGRLHAARNDLERLPGVVDELLQRLRSGATLRSVWAPLADEVEGLCDRAADTAVALAAGLIRASVESSLEAGGPATDGLQRLRYTLAGSVQAERLARSAAAQALASAALLCAAPGVFAVVVASVHPELRAFYLHRGAGLVCLLISIGLVYGGWWWMQRLIASLGAPGRRLLLTPASRRLALHEEARRCLAQTVDLLAVCLGSGKTLPAALELVASRGPAVVRDGFASVLARCREGSTLADALPVLVDQLGPAYQPLAGALVVNEQGGASLGLLLGRLADDAESARRFHHELLARRLPIALLPPLTVCMLPAIVVGTLVPLVVVSFGDLGLG